MVTSTHIHPGKPIRAFVRARVGRRKTICCWRARFFLFWGFGLCVASLVGVGSVPGDQTGCQGAVWSLAPIHTVIRQRSSSGTRTSVAARPFPPIISDFLAFPEIRVCGEGWRLLASHSLLELAAGEKNGHHHSCAPWEAKKSLQACLHRSLRG